MTEANKQEQVSQEVENEEAEQQEEVNEEEKQEEVESEKKYTDEEVNAIIDKKFAKWQKELEEKQEEAEKLAKMNSDEKLKYENEQMKKQLEEFQAKENRAKMKQEANSMLLEADIKLPETLLDVLVTDEAETTREAVTGFTEAFNEAVESRTKELLRGESPKTPKGSTKLTREDIEKIENPIERQRLIAENLELFN